MAEYAITKILKAGITLWLIFTLSFFATRISGDAIDYLVPEGADAKSKAAMVEYYGLDRPWGEQYLAAVRRNTFTGFAIQAGAFFGYAVPNFVLAILMILVFSFHLQLLPSGGSDTWRHYVMPVTALACTLIASLTRFSRSAMLDVLSQDYIRTARAKGLGELAVISVHGLRNALITIVTVVGLQAAVLVSGAVVIENVFSWPGIGELLVFSALQRDYPLLQSGVVLVGSVVIIINLLVDMAYAVIDPAVASGS